MRTMRSSPIITHWLWFHCFSCHTQLAEVFCVWHQQYWWLCVQFVAKRKLQTKFIMSTAEKAHEAREVDLTAAARGVWLVKVSKTETSNRARDIGLVGDIALGMDSDGCLTAISGCKIFVYTGALKWHLTISRSWQSDLSKQEPIAVVTIMVMAHRSWRSFRILCQKH